MKAAEELRLAVQIEEATRIEQSGEHLRGLLSESVAGEAGGDERIVVRPDGSVVIRHRVVARGAHGHGANAPAGEPRGVRQRRCDATRPRRARDAGVEALSGIRGDDATWLLVAVQCERVGGEILAPERELEAMTQDS